MLGVTKMKDKENDSLRLRWKYLSNILFLILANVVS